MVTTVVTQNSEENFNNLTNHPFPFVDNKDDTVEEEVSKEDIFVTLEHN